MGDKKWIVGAGIIMKAKDMVVGNWYQFSPNTHGRFTCRCKRPIIMVGLDGDCDMQSQMIITDPETEVEEAVAKYTDC